MSQTEAKQYVLETPEGFAKVETGFQKAMGFIRDLEGGYGEMGAERSNMGVRQETYDGWRQKQGLESRDIKEIADAEVDSIYDQEFYSGMDFEQIKNPKVRNVVFSTEINTPYREGIKGLQKMVGAKEDGYLGEKTNAAIDKRIAEVGEDEFLEEVLQAKLAFYENVAAKNPEKAKYLKGWKNRVEKERKQLDLSFLNPFNIKEAEAAEAEMPEISEKKETPPLPEGYQRAYALDVPEGYVKLTDDMGGTLSGETEISAMDEPGIISRGLEFLAQNAFPQLESTKALLPKKQDPRVRADAIYTLAKANRLPISFVRDNFDKIAKNERFTGIKPSFGDKESSEKNKTLVQNIGEGLTFGFYQSDEALQQRYPVEAGAGQVVGGIAAFLGTAEVLGVLGLGRLALGVGKKAETISRLAPRFLPPAIMSGTVFMTNDGLREAADQVHKKDLNVWKLGGKSAKGFFTGVGLGAAGAQMGHARRVVMASGVGYVSGKVDGQSNTEAALTGVIFGGFELLGGSGRDVKLKGNAFNNLRQRATEYVKMKDPNLSKAQAEKMVDFYIAKTSESLGGFKKAFDETPIQLWEKISKRLVDTMKNWKGVKTANVLETRVPSEGAIIKANQGDLDALRTEREDLVGAAVTALKSMDVFQGLGKGGNLVDTGVDGKKVKAGLPDVLKHPETGKKPTSEKQWRELAEHNIKREMVEPGMRSALDEVDQAIIMVESQLEPAASIKPPSKEARVQAWRESEVAKNVPKEIMDKANPVIKEADALVGEKYHNGYHKIDALVSTLSSLDGALARYSQAVDATRRGYKRARNPEDSVPRINELVARAKEQIASIKESNPKAPPPPETPASEIGYAKRDFLSGHQIRTAGMWGESYGFNLVSPNGDLIEHSSSEVALIKKFASIVGKDAFQEELDYDKKQYEKMRPQGELFGHDREAIVPRKSPGQQPKAAIIPEDVSLLTEVSREYPTPEAFEKGMLQMKKSDPTKYEKIVNLLTKEEGFARISEGEQYGKIERQKLRRDAERIKREFRGRPNGLSSERAIQPAELKANKLQQQTIVTIDDANKFIDANGLSLHKHDFSTANAIEAALANPAFQKLAIFDKIRVAAQLERVDRNRDYSTNISVSTAKNAKTQTSSSSIQSLENTKTEGDDILPADTIKGCDNNCFECFALKSTAKPGINHQNPIKAKLSGVMKNGQKLRVGTIGDPAKDWAHSAKEVQGVLERSQLKGHDVTADKNVFVITKLQSLEGFEPSVFKNLEVSLDPFYPAHLFQSIKNIAILKDKYPNVNIVSRIRSVATTNGALNASQDFAIKKMNDFGIIVLETKMRFRRKSSFDILELDPKKYERVGNQFKMIGSPIKKAVKKHRMCDDKGTGLCRDCQNCVKTMFTDRSKNIKNSNNSIQKVLGNLKKKLKSESGFARIGKGDDNPDFKKLHGKLQGKIGDVSLSGKIEQSEPPFTSMSKDKRKAKAKKMKEAQEKIPFEADYSAGAYEALKKRQGMLAAQNLSVNKFLNDLKHSMTEKQAETIGLMIEGKGVPKALNDKDIERIYKEEKEDLKPIIELVEAHFDKELRYYNKYNPDTPISEVENYVTRLWDFPRRDKKKIPDVVSYFTTNNRFAKKRTLTSIVEGMDKFGLKPKTLNIIDILRIHSSVINRSVANKIFVQDIKALEVGGVKLVERSDKAPIDWVKIDHPAINEVMVIPGELKRGEKVSEELTAILHELGVIIGRRLNPTVFGKPNEKAGQFRPGEKPEINLQRFFTSETMAHELGHFLDQKLALTGINKMKGKKSSEFFDRFKNEFYAVNKDRIEQFKGTPKQGYAESAEEQIAEYFALLFTDPQKATEIAPLTTEYVMRRLNSDESLKALTNFDFKNKAKNLIDEQMVTLTKTAVSVHPSIAKVVKAVLGSRIDNPWVRGYEAVNGVLKKSQLSLSLFHHIALGETSIPTMGVRKTLDLAFNFPKIYRALAKGEFEVYKQEEAAREWVMNGLQLGATADIPVHKIQQGLDNLAKKLKDVPVFAQAAKFLATFNEVWDKALWEYYHDTMKLLASETLLERHYTSHLESGKDVPFSRKEAMEEISGMVNDTFGGQNWERLLVAPSSLQMAGWALLSPDWTISTIRQGFALTGAGAINKNTKGLRGKMGRQFWLKALLYFGVGINLLNAANRKYDEMKYPEKYDFKDMGFFDYTLVGNALGHKTHLFAGRYADGTERYIRWGKQFREVAELVFDKTGLNPIGATIKKLFGKAAPVPQLVSVVGTGHSLSGFRIREVAEAEGWERTVAIFGSLLKSPLPFSLRTIGQEEKNFFITDLAMPSSKGMTRYSAIKFMKYAIEGGDEALFKEAYVDALDNNLPAMILADAAITSLKAEGTREINSHVKTIEDIDEAYETATDKEKRVLIRNKTRLLKEKMILDEGIGLLEASLEKLKGLGYINYEGEE